MAADLDAADANIGAPVIAGREIDEGSPDVLIPDRAVYPVQLFQPGLKLPRQVREHI